MRVVLQRVSKASVTVSGEVKGAIGTGLMILVGVGEGDTDVAARKLADKIVHMRIFEDDKGKLNWSLQNVEGSALVVSQFTLYADCRKGRRPSFIKAAELGVAEALYEHFCNLLRSYGIRVETGVFAATMELYINNQGPVTILLDSEKL